MSLLVFEIIKESLKTHSCQQSELREHSQVSAIAFNLGDTLVILLFKAFTRREIKWLKLIIEHLVFFTASPFFSLISKLMSYN